MIPKNLNVEEFAKNMTEQAYQAIPPELPENVKNCVANTIYQFIKISAAELAKEQHEYNENDTVLICQLIGEWMYHKGIDNYKNEIPQKYWEPILQQIALAIYQTAKNAVTEGKKQNEVVDVTEMAVMQTYRQLIEQLAGQNELKKSVDEIMKQSNLQDYVQQGVEEEEKNIGTNEKEMKYMCIALFIKSLPMEKVGSFVKMLPQDAKNKIEGYLANPNLERVVDPMLYQEYMEKFNNFMPKVKIKKRTNRMFARFDKAYENVSPDEFEEIIKNERRNVKNFLLHTYNGKMYKENLFSLDLQNAIIDFAVQKEQES